MLPHNNRIIEWDDKKHVSNLEKHGLDFEDANSQDWERATIIFSPRELEPRRIALARFPDDAGGPIYAVVYTIREGRVRLISFRRAKKSEVRIHESERGTQLDAY